MLAKRILARATRRDGDPAALMLRGGLLPCLAVGLIAGLASAFDGPAAAVGAGLGAMAVAAAMSLGPLAMRLTRDWSPPAVMGIAVAAYAVAVLALGLGYLLLGRASWVSSGHLGVSMIACAAGWLAGEVRVVYRLRVPAFGEPAGNQPSG